MVDHDNILRQLYCHYSGRQFSECIIIVSFGAPVGGLIMPEARACVGPTEVALGCTWSARFEAGDA